MIGLVGALTGRILGGISTGQRVAKAGVLNTLEDIGRDAIISAFGGRGSAVGMALNALLEMSEQADKDLDRQARRRQKREEKAKNASPAQKRRAQQNHREWLEQNRWRFDWRSQPRRPAGTDAGGEWMPGRLDYPVASKNVISRKQRQQRIRAMKAYKERRREAGEVRTRTIRSAWGEF